MIIRTCSYQETVALGQYLGTLLQAGDVLLLDGDLGVGKTTLTRGIAQGLGINRSIKSPTFTLIREYQNGRVPLYHMDMYRLENAADSALGLEEYLGSDGVTVMEWAQFVADQLPEEYLLVQIARDNDQDEERFITFKPRGEHYQSLLNNFIAMYQKHSR
ncbi:tRNA (adenosine(37)-N6)-threonylcarbamoyltransferase complex ATPase subunit type 1 TsaE [Bombilactobacillus thymidiniphilus]|uniref:tRNA threonylcarbamoyladenosine biosynthesis protein TsaE n=1 Tax=Bombilactobacillus thymidiniphilus TaxID=2923363 RepID=A0ABY4PDW4_9LACO|nr:tRNA (adenosine(37)-N6)-threonylcarbamoyltransferase complex ATPase subunit type 1 TsaE [Bombilactobacillus thymidiniphilus]UQS83815.1 tRNA (adenosine(37)-N6)-threonylcarbamoyltransferase complex ATPase subunit type 1 TsaE [Bombilactobacillus thymidiniphilus]